MQLYLYLNLLSKENGKPALDLSPYSRKNYSATLSKKAYAYVRFSSLLTTKNAVNTITKV